MAFVISADSIKEAMPDYDPGHSEKLHRKSAKLADKEFQQAVKQRPERTVVLMSGGAASGKTEYVSAYLNQADAIVFDGTLPTSKGAKIKIDRAIKQSKDVEIHTVLPSSLETAFIAFLNRDRKFPTEHFYRTHSASRKALLEVAVTFPDIPIKVFLSKYKHDKTTADVEFTELQIADRGELIDFLERSQYTETEIKQSQGIYDL